MAITLDELKKIKIFVEGKADKVFIRDVLKEWYSIELEENQLNELVIVCHGFAGLQKQKDEFLQIGKNQKREGGKNIVIFDADINGNAEFHGVKEKKTYLDSLKQSLGIEYEYFLFPDNDSDGTLENLLEICINPEHKGIFECWEAFEACVSAKNPNYKLPANKSKIYVYLECLLGDGNSKKSKIKDENRDFTDKNFWKISETQDFRIEKFKSFLNQTFNI